MGKWGTARKWTPEEAAEAVRLYGTGASLCEVGRQLGRDPSSVRVMFRRHGVPVRDAKTAYRQWAERQRQAEAAAIAEALS